MCCILLKSVVICVLTHYTSITVRYFDTTQNSISKRIGTINNALKYGLEPWSWTWLGGISWLDLLFTCTVCTYSRSSSSNSTSVLWWCSNSRSMRSSWHLAKPWMMLMHININDTNSHHTHWTHKHSCVPTQVLCIHHCGNNSQC